MRWDVRQIDGDFRMMGGVGKCWFGWGGVNGCAMTE
jgi:hypothetical protein